MTVDHRSDHLSMLRSVLSVVVYPAQFIATIPQNTYNWIDKKLSSKQSLIRQNEKLIKENLTNKQSNVRATFLPNQPTDQLSNELMN